MPNDSKPRPRLSYVLASAVLAGFAGAALSSVAADILDVSKTIAGVTGGLLLAVTVAAAIHEHGESEKNTSDE